MFYVYSLNEYNFHLKIVEKNQCGVNVRETLFDRLIELREKFAFMYDVIEKI